MPPTPNSSAPLTKSGWRVGGSNSGGNASENSFPAPTGRLVLEDGTVFTGTGVGKIGAAVGEVCFNTAMTGYQEIISDPSYAGQIITFTFPHIGNVGINPNDLESAQPAARGVILRAPITDPSNYRASGPLSQWLADNNLVDVDRIHPSGNHQGAVLGDQIQNRVRTTNDRPDRLNAHTIDDAGHR